MTELRDELSARRLLVMNLPYDYYRSSPAWLSLYRAAWVMYGGVHDD